MNFSPTTVRATGRSVVGRFYRFNGEYNVGEEGAVYELRTGIDPNGADPDIEISFQDEYLVNEMWFDPDPVARTAPVPSDRIDAYGVSLHELGHAIGFNGFRDGFGKVPGNFISRWDEYVVSDGQDVLFTGPTAKRVYGGDVPVTWGVPNHLGNNPPRPGSDLIPDVMNGVVAFRGRRYSISDLDLAIINDVGVPVSSFSPPVTVIDRRIFYNASAFDGRNPAATPNDLAAVAPDKRALLPGEAPSFQNISSYSRGINGVLVRFDGTPSSLTAADFEFRVGIGPGAADWGPGPLPASMIVVPAPPGIDGALCLITWSSGAITDKWLEVKVKANGNTGLAQPDIFYFGSLPGETGDANSRSDAAAMVTATDLVGTRRAAGAPARIDSRYDFDRNGVISAADFIVGRNHLGLSLIAFVRPAAPFEALRASSPKDDVESLLHARYGFG